MQLLLTATGHRWTLHQLKDLGPGQVPGELALAEWTLLLELALHRVVPYPCPVATGTLLAKGLVEVSPVPLGQAALALRARRNPLEHLDRVAIEFTTACGFQCLHCRNAAQAPVTEAAPERLFPAVDLLAGMGILRFEFIGGEVSRFGTGWLDVVNRIRAWPGATVTTLTSGWFLEQEDFMAAGRRYAKDLALLEDLAREGVTHLTFSLDGPQDVHDRFRRTPGLYRRVLAGLGKARRAGLKPQVSLLGAPRPWLEAAARALYPEAGREALGPLLERVAQDPHNYMSHLVDVGGAARLRKGGSPVSAIPDAALPCRAFFRPRPTLRLNANGQVATCPLMGDAEGFGSFHERPLGDVLNHMHEAPVFRLHAERRLAAYRRFLDPRFFPGGVDHVCTLRTALTRLALLMGARGVDPEDAVAVRRVNEEVARSMGERLAPDQ